jgi:hypothetical protein
MVGWAVHMAEPDPNFWWNWWVQAAVAAGTIGAVVVALFSEPIRWWLGLRPILQISPTQNAQEGTQARTVATEIVDGELKQRTTASRWYHIDVVNKRRDFATATQVRVWMIELAVFDPKVSGNWRTDWIGEMPMSWKDPYVKSPAITIGHPDVADLCSLTRGDAGQPHRLQLSAVILKYPPTLQWIGQSCHIRVKLQARSVETSSNVLTMQIWWDGQWHDDDIAMQAHLTVTRVSV